MPTAHFPYAVIGRVGNQKHEERYATRAQAERAAKKIRAMNSGRPGFSVRIKKLSGAKTKGFGDMFGRF